MGLTLWVLISIWLLQLVSGDYPKNIKNIVTKLTSCTQNALRKQESRVQVELPPGAAFGVETKKAQTDNDKVMQSNREIALLYCEMFKVLSGTSTVLFPTENEASVARNMWGSKFSGKVLSIDVKPSKGMGKLRSRKFSAEEQEAALLGTDGVYVPDETELLLIVGPRMKDYKKIKKLHGKFGDGTLFILINPYLDAAVQLTKSLDDETKETIEWIDQTFTNVFTYKPPVAEGVVGKDLLLYHEYDGKWLLAEKTMDKGLLGMESVTFKTILESDKKPDKTSISSAAKGQQG
jgi:hypothetical protein